ncbi:hypothetical protein BDAP_002615 [Binucleata daphniae]
MPCIAKHCEVTKQIDGNGTNVNDDLNYCRVIFEAIPKNYEEYLNELTKNNIIKATHLEINECVITFLTYIKQKMLLTLFDTMITDYFDNNRNVFEGCILYKTYSEKAVNFFVTTFTHKLNDLNLLNIVTVKNDSISYTKLFGDGMEELFSFIPNTNELNIKFERTEEFVLFCEFLKTRMECKLANCRNVIKSKICDENLIKTVINKLCC